MSDIESLKGAQHVDVEKQLSAEPGFLAAPVEAAAMTGPWAKLLKRLGDGGVEVEGMDRIREDQRSTDKGWGQLLFWFSVSSSAHLAGDGQEARRSGWPVLSAEPAPTPCIS